MPWPSLTEATAGNSSFSRVSPGLQLAVDSHSLGQFKACPRLYYYSVVLGYQPRELSVHLQFGLLMHSGLERYHHAKAAGQGHNDALASALGWLLAETWNTRLRRPWQSDHAIKHRGTLIRTLVWYLDQFEEDPLETVILASGKPAVELSFRFESGFQSHDGEPFVLCGHLDRLARLNGVPYIPDFKTTLYTLTSSWFEKFTPGNQFSMYCLAGQVVWSEPVQGLIVDGAQIAQGFSRFERALVPRPQTVLDEWLADTGRWLARMEACALEGQRREALGLDPAEAWSLNDTSCDRYGGCQFRSIDSKAPASRQRWLEQDFHRRVWDPLQARGDI